MSGTNLNSKLNNNFSSKYGRGHSNPPKSNLKNENSYSFKGLNNNKFGLGKI